MNVKDIIPDLSDEPDYEAIGRNLASIDFSLPENQITREEFNAKSKNITGQTIIVIPVGSSTRGRRGRSRSSGI